MKLMFFMPNAVVLKDPPRRSHDTLTHAGENYAVYRHMRLHPKPDSDIASFERDDRHNYLIEVAPGVFAGASQEPSDDQFRKNLDGLRPGYVAEYKAKHLAALADPEAATAELQAKNAERRAKVAAEREQRDKEQREREAEWARRQEAALLAEAGKFASGEMIAWSDFETLCNRHGITMHIRTIGSARRRVSRIGISRMMVQKSFAPNGVYAAARELKAALTSEANREDDEDRCPFAPPGAYIDGPPCCHGDNELTEAS